jgi:hypothetical protein
MKTLIEIINTDNEPNPLQTMEWDKANTMKKPEIYTIVRPGQHYDTNDQRWYKYSWECTKDSKEYLQTLIKNNPRQFHNATIISNI